MAINVICPGCMKRFQVSDRFAGQKGPCPSCNTIINIPKAAIKIHGAEEFEAGGRSATGKLLLKPLARVVEDFHPLKAAFAVVGTLLVLLLTVAIGFFSISTTTLNIIGLIGLLCVSFPICLFCYQILRNREELFVMTGMDLHKMIALTAGIYVVLWFSLEALLWYTDTSGWPVLIWFLPMLFFGMLAAHVVLDIDLGNAFLHCLVFSLAVVILRGLVGLGWLWTLKMAGTVSELGPPPIL